MFTTSGVTVTRLQEDVMGDSQKNGWHFTFGTRWWLLVSNPKCDHDNDSVEDAVRAFIEHGNSGDRTTYTDFIVISDCEFIYTLWNGEVGRVRYMARKDGS